MRYKVIYINKWFVIDTYRDRVIDTFQNKETAERVADLFEDMSLLSRKEDDLK